MLPLPEGSSPGQTLAVTSVDAAANVKSAMLLVISLAQFGLAFIWARQPSNAFSRILYRRKEAAVRVSDQNVSVCLSFTKTPSLIRTGGA